MRVNDIATELLNRIEAATADIAEKPSVYWMWGDVLWHGRVRRVRSTTSSNLLAASTRSLSGQMKNAPKSTQSCRWKLSTYWQPDVIYLWFNDELDPADILEGKTVGDFDFSTWADLPAVVNGQVFELDDPFAFDLMAAHMPIGVLKIASDINPAAFADWDLAAEQDALFTALYGLHYPSYEVAE
jgi:iron complex transport system substrate-binding protein